MTAFAMNKVFGFRVVDLDVDEVASASRPL